MKKVENKTTSGKKAAIAQIELRQFTLENMQTRIIDRALFCDSEIDSMAGRIATKRAQFHFSGSSALVIARGKNKGSRISRAVAIASNCKVAPIIRNGTGNGLDRQAIQEMTLAARAALIQCARLAIMTDQEIIDSGIDLATARAMSTSRFSAIKAASKAAASELHHATREMIFDDCEKARRAIDRAHNRARETWKTCEPEPNQTQPHCAEFLTDKETEFLNPRAVIARGLIRARRAIRAAYSVKKYPRAKKDCAQDLRALRLLARKIDQGIARQAAREDMAEYMHLRRLEERAQSGFAILAKLEPEPIAQPEPIKSARAPRAARLSVLPLGKRENWLHDFKLGLIPIARRLLDRAPSDCLASLAAWKFAMR